MPIATPISAALRAGASFAVARHGDYPALALPGFDYAYLVFRGDAGVGGDPLELGIELLVAHRVELDSGYCLIAVAEYSDLAGYGCRGDLVVAGYHDGAHASAGCVGDGLDGLRARRVYHGYEPEEGEAMFIVEGEPVRSAELAHGKREDTQAVLRPLHVYFGYALAPLGCHLFRPVRSEHAV